MTTRWVDPAVTARRGRAAVLAYRAALVLVAAHAIDALVEKPSDRPLAVEMALGVLVVVAALIGGVTFVRRGPLGRGVLALLLGTGAVIEGAGVTAAHIVRDGPSGADLTGVPSLIAGVLMLALGTVLVLGRVRGWWRLLAVPAGFALLLWVIAPLVMAVVATHPAAKPVGVRTPSDFGLAYTSVTVTTRDGARLAGWYIPSRNRAAVVAVPGAWSTRSDVLDQVVVLARHGYGVLDLDPRGHGDSSGTAMDFGWFGDADLDAAVSYLAGRPDVDASRVGALGLSMGGEEVLGAAASDARIRAVVSEGGSNRTVEDYGAIAGREWLMMPAYWLVTAASDLLSPAARPAALVDAVARIAPRPVLLITASDEPELTLVRHLRDAAPATTQLWEPAATAHTQALATHPAEWASRVLGFLDSALLTPA